MRNLIIKVSAALYIGFLFLTFAGDAWAGECLSYEPVKVELAGTIVRQTFPGPPEYESIEKGDEPETFWILNLKKPVCVKGNPDDELNSETEKNVKKMHMVLNQEMYARYKGLVLKGVIVEGTLYHAITAHHRTRVLINVISIKPAEDKNRK